MSQFCAMHPVRTFRHCPVCSAKPRFEGERKLICPRCGLEYFFNSAAAVGVILTRGIEVLMTRRSRDPGRGLLDLPGGFVDPGESAEMTACREIREELGIDLDPAALRYAGSGENLYEYAGVTYRTLDLFFATPLTAEQAEILVPDPDEIGELFFLGADEFDPAQFAFPSHSGILANYFGDIRGTG